MVCGELRILSGDMPLVECSEMGLDILFEKITRVGHELRLILC